ncbi:MAG: hypothetical protein ACLURV_02285 [Gallintestinimicrobium sp.]
MKKKNVNKLLALGLVSAMTAGMLAGCETQHPQQQTMVLLTQPLKLRMTKLPPILRRQTMVKCLL